MKKALTVVLVLALALCSVFAGDFKFLFTELDQHPEILAGFLPTLTAIGAGYEGLSLIDGNLTQLQFTIGGGYTQRALFQNPDNGEPLLDDIMLYDQIQLRWNFKFLQGFGDSWVEGKDLVTAYVGYEGRYEKAVDSMKVHEERYRGYADADTRTKGKTPIPSLDEWFNDHFPSTLAGNRIYPDLADDYTAFMTNFYLGARLNLMDDRMVSNEGALAEIKLQFAPSFLNKKASYYSITFNAVAGTTLLEVSNKKGQNLFSIVLIDRLNVNWTDGSKVPVYASMPVSLGRKVRGFNTNSYNTNFTVVNNLDLRLAGPEFIMDGVFPRLNLFFDMGWHAGNYFNSDNSASAMAEKYDLKRFLCSAGFQLEMCIFDFIDLGFQLSYLISGDNMRTPGEKFITGATFFLDF
ncbi:MAG: BamA/TamA family outer membrane protein [bacterium]|nr:BamA/TamA family outer membrane protein [Spirochaetales bacterium]MDT3390292.1 BamA/TamA family outer membrane protein [bacterium]